MVKWTRHSSNSAPQTYKKINCETTGQCRVNANQERWRATYYNPTRNSKCTDLPLLHVPTYIHAYTAAGIRRQRRRPPPPNFGVIRIPTWSVFKGAKSLSWKLHLRSTPAAVVPQLGSIANAIQAKSRNQTVQGPSEWMCLPNQTH